MPKERGMINFAQLNLVGLKIYQRRKMPIISREIDKFGAQLLMRKNQN